MEATERNRGKKGPEEPIRIAAYDPGWAARFEHESGLLQDAIGAWASGDIHHVAHGLPGLDAEPAIDILVGVENLAIARAASERWPPSATTTAPTGPKGRRIGSASRARAIERTTFISSRQGRSPRPDVEAVEDHARFRTAPPVPADTRHLDVVVGNTGVARCLRGVDAARRTNQGMSSE